MKKQITYDKWMHTTTIQKDGEDTPIDIFFSEANGKYYVSFGDEHIAIVKSKGEAYKVANQVLNIWLKYAQN